MSNQNEKNVAPGTTKDEPGTGHAAPQQKQGDAKPANEKPAEQQK